MDFRVLGTLEVWDGDERVEISGRLHPKILAGLLLNAGRTVSLAWLVDLLWDDDPPATARRQVQNAVAALRRRLEPVRAGLIERVGQEYRVNIADDELDLRRFDAAAREARRFAKAGQWTAALHGFDLALTLRRGPAFDGLSGRVLEAAAGRLDDKYLSTYEQYADAAITVGQARRVIDRLQELVAEHPLRQHLTGQLMLALHQSNRTTEALRLFESLRDRFVDELGLDPANDLKDLHVRILQGNTSLRTQTIHSQHPNSSELRRSLPAQLPTDVASFTGREKQLAALDRLRDSGAQTGIISAITGIGGVGKTALAIRWGHTRREDFPDGQLYINLRGFDEREPLTPYEAVSRLLRSLGHPANDIPNDIVEAAGLYRSLLADKRILVLLDNARTAEQVLPLLPHSPGSLAVVTSRNRLSSLVASHDAQPIELDTLRPDEALELFAELIGADTLDDTEVTRQLIKLCGYLPLALRIVAANWVQNTQKSLAQLVTELGGPSRLSQLNIDDDAATNLATVFDLSYRALSPNACQAFHYLGLIPGDDFTADLVAALLNISVETVRTSISELEHVNFLDQHGPGRYRCHDLVRIYIRQVSKEKLSEPCREEAVARLITWYTENAYTNPVEFNNVVAVCDAFPGHDNLWRIIKTFRLSDGDGTNIQTAKQRVEAILHAIKNSSTSNVEAMINTLTTLAAINHTIGANQTAKDNCKEAVSLLDHTSSAELRGHVLGTFGMILYANGDYMEAEHNLQRALLLAENSQDNRQVVLRAGNLGRVYRALGRFHESENLLKHCQEIATNETLPNLQAATLASLGYLYCDMGHNEQAIQAAQEAIKIARAINATRITILATLYAGRAFQAMGHCSKALEYLEAALDIARHEGRRGLQKELLEDIAEAHAASGNRHQALAHLRAAREVASSGNLKIRKTGKQARILCRTFLASGEFDLAIEHGTEACESYRRCTDELVRLARSLDTLGQAHLSSGDLAAATTCWTEALDIFTRLDVPEAAKLRARLHSAELQ